VIFILVSVLDTRLASENSIPPSLILIVNPGTELNPAQIKYKNSLKKSRHPFPTLPYRPMLQKILSNENLNTIKLDLINQSLLSAPETLVDENIW
jgi:hypothetical protein